MYGSNWAVLAHSMSFLLGKANAIYGYNSASLAFVALTFADGSLLKSFTILSGDAAAAAPVALWLGAVAAGSFVGLCALQVWQARSRKGMKEVGNNESEKSTKVKSKLR